MDTNQSSDEHVLTIPVTQPNARITLRDPMFVSVCTSTSSPAEPEHPLSINVREGVNLHFASLFMALSDADWDRVVAGVEQARRAREAGAA